MRCRAQSSLDFQEGVLAGKMSFAGEEKVATGRRKGKKGAAFFMSHHSRLESKNYQPQASVEEVKGRGELNKRNKRLRDGASLWGGNRRGT